MDYVITRLATNPTENTALESWEIVLRGPLTLWWALGLAVALAAGAVVLYANERGRLGWLRFIVLSLLRTTVLAVLLCLLLGPAIVAEFQDKRPRPVVLLVDNSLSMKQQDHRLSPEDRYRVALAKGLAPIKIEKLDKAIAANLPSQTPKNPSRLELVRGVLEHQELKLGESLGKIGEVRPFLFGQRLHGPGEDDEKTKEPIAALLASLQAGEDRTNVADAVQEILQRKDGDLPAAIVLMTDGLDNASKFRLDESAEKCRDLGVPLHIYGVGTAEGGSLRLREVGIRDTLFYDDKVYVPVRWRAQGFKEGTVEITLKLGDKIVATKEVPLRLGDDLREELSFTPEKGPDGKRTELLDLVASIRLKGGPAIKQPDDVKKKIRLLDSKVKVLYIEGSPRWEYKFLQATLVRDRRVEAQFLLTNADSRVLESGPPFLAAFPATKEKFFDAKYNLIILGDVPADYFRDEQLEWIAEFVSKNRGGLIAIAGRQHMPGEYVKKPLAAILPVEVKPGRQVSDPDKTRTQEYPPTLTAIGERRAMLALAETAEDNRKLWDGLPGFHFHYPLVKLRSGAVSLVVNPRAKLGEEPMPVLVTHYAGKGQVMFLGTDETWRWRFNAAGKHYDRFWGQIISEMGLPHLLGENAQRAQIELEGGEAILGKPGKIHVRLLDKEFNPRKEKEIEATLEALEGKDPKKRIEKIKLFPLEEPGRGGEYWAMLDHSLPGLYELRVNNPEPVSFSFRVNAPPRHELDEASMAEPALRQMARISGGQFYREEDLSRLAESIPRRLAAFTWREELSLYPLLLVLFILLITTEWLVRKFSDLS